MTSTLGLSHPTNSSSTSPMTFRSSTGSKHASEGFSALMRLKQEASRVAACAPVGGQVQGVMGQGSGTAPFDGKSIGPRGDPAPPPRDPEEFQRYGHDRSRERQAPDALAPWVEPLQRVLAHSTPSPESVAANATNSTLAMAELWRAVRRVAWGGDRHRSVAYIELGAGALDGAAVTLEARGSAISIVLELPPGTSSAGWGQRLADRLARRGLEVESVEVR